MKKLNNNKFIIGCLLLSVIAFASCKKQLDINQNPNYPTLSQGNPSLVFPAAVLSTTAEVGGNLAIVGGIWSQFFTQAALAQQYAPIESYYLPSTDPTVNQSWDNLYTNGLKNYQYVIDQAALSGDWNYYLMGTVMKAYTAEVLVDLYDQIPYSKALQGGSNLNPTFDRGDSIYFSLIASIDNALSKDFSASTNTPPGTQDMVFGGNISNWIAFANTLKLKMYLRMINVYPAISQAGIKSLSGATFLSVDASVTNFTNNPSLDNPMYESNKRSLNTPDNIRGSRTFASWLQANNDSRLSYYMPAPAGYTIPNSVNQGDYLTPHDTGYAKAPDFAETATDPVEFISLPEAYFLQAEADLRYNGGANAQTLYNKGVLAAFSQVGQDGSSYTAAGGVYAYPTSGTMAQQLQAIIVQKWASCAYGCHGIESFFEQNRTGYPLRSSVYSTAYPNPANSYIPGQLVISINSTLGAGQVPKRFVFPYDEASRNTNTPATVPETTKVWWGL